MGITKFHVQTSDEELVAASLRGDPRSFEEIVCSYQGLLSSLAYSAVGSLKASEDVTQEAFIAAWRGLPELREPAKLRNRLCAIVRQLSLKSLRRISAEPAERAELLSPRHL